MHTEATERSRKSPLGPASADRIESKVRDLLSRMSLEEKVAQMRIVHANLGVSLDEDGQLVLSDHFKEQVKHGIAGIKNPGEHDSPQDAARINNLLQKYLVENSRHGIPALFVTESYNGVDAAGTTDFSRPINMAASWNPELVRRVWDQVGREARARGMHMCHSPEADLIRDPRFGRMSETFGEDTHLVSEMVVAAVTGVQGDYHGLASTHIGAVTKHFAGYGQVEGGRNFASVQISERDLADQILPPFQAAVQRAKTLGIMASHGDLNGVACHANKQLLTDILRDQWGFNGYTVSDANDIGRLFYFMAVAENEDEAALLGLKAGMNVDLYNEDCYVRLPQLAAKDTSLIPLIDQAAGNVLRAKFILGLFENPYASEEQARAISRSPSALQLALESELDSLILLKNENKTLPLDPRATPKIALVGPLLKPNTLAQFQEVAGDSIAFVAEKGFSLTNGDINYPDLLTPEQCAPGLEKAVQAAASADATVLFVGGDEFTAKEAFFDFAIGDRASIDLLGSQVELFRRLKALGKPVIVALKHRRTLAINELAAEADAILDAWDPGEQGDTAIAMTLFGHSVPSGKLPVTVPRTIGQLPFHYSQKKINFKKGYMFMENGPLYPFGFGLSYTTFHYQDLQLSAKQVANGDSLSASIKISNTGDRPGKEVVQLYIQDPIGTVVRPAKELKAFRKIYLEPGESQTISFAIAPEMLACTGADNVRKVENGDFVVQVGSSSETFLEQRFQVV
ncbi:glycoside hydrolase family 3 N-terminal domain-containing protein [Pelagicoccus sp. SDUM812005]|uniref:glycoside hydrolase family 3 N-terminal domain-containing protein n=1 Tax=Pelagicoccus sp. SDUM812005 TaxID=3041257 RepID=UPI00280FA63B|nr:glycoside hydrolase family 3 N-terminal domain-containing protein [Pelagicoccus sp. SDUM812005]MDQ8179191.1 glycoside hydrolase family 3 N-terminal domain-containing protein [Pelagicoccus sp. SDUM812005]